eukprot:GSA120T00013134001.1
MSLVDQTPKSATKIVTPHSDSMKKTVKYPPGMNPQIEVDAIRNSRKQLFFPERTQSVTRTSSTEPARVPKPPTVHATPDIFGGNGRVVVTNKRKIVPSPTTSSKGSEKSTSTTPGGDKNSATKLLTSVRNTSAKKKNLQQQQHFEIPASAIPTTTVGRPVVTTTSTSLDLNTVTANDGSNGANGLALLPDSVETPLQQQQTSQTGEVEQQDNSLFFQHLAG